MIASAQTAAPLPPRYQQEWGAEFWTFVDGALHDGATVLDIGAGRRPTISPERRPAGSHYVGLDIAARELEAAPPGCYDETVVADAQTLVPDLVDRFDLIVAWQVLEHIQDLDRAADVFHRYATARGSFVACLSGRNAVFALANRLLPASLSRHLVARLMRRPVETVFPAYYDRCDENGLHGAFSGWQEVRVIPLWRGADYFARFPHLRPLYVRYEDWAIERGSTNLATHYVVAARKGERPA
jgi:SAM-dependent methyltransferase